MANSPALQQTPVYLFLTKVRHGQCGCSDLTRQVDVFRELIPHVPLTTTFPHFVAKEGADAAEAGMEFVRHRFLERLLNARPVYVHFSCPVDVLNARVTLHAMLQSLKNIVVLV